MTKIGDLKEGQKIAGRFGVTKKDWLKEYSRGKFFRIEITDGDTKIPLKFWGSPLNSRAAELYDNLRPGSAVDIEGNIVYDNYDNCLTVSVNEDGNKFRICAPGEVEKTEFVKKTEKNQMQLFAYVQKEIEGIKNEHLAALLNAIFADEHIKSQFIESPAAKEKHHAYLGGLLEHTCNVMKICSTLCEIYPELDRDLLITAAILHDIGKIQEYSVDVVIDISNAGKFLTHTYISIEIIENKLRQIPDFPENLKLKLYHAILRHHGRWSSQETIETKTSWVIPEACALYYADDADARIKNFLQHIEEGKKHGENWHFIKDLGSEIYIEDEDD
jgi:3'-5' exoribonuclease